MGNLRIALQNRMGAEGVDADTLHDVAAILDEAALSFLGLGAQPPTPEWGTMLAGALQYYQRAWWMLTPAWCIRS